MADARTRQPVKITDPTTDANEAGVDASGNLQVILGANDGVDIGDADITSVIPGVGATNLGKAEDAASAGGDVGVAQLAIQDAILGALSSIDGDYSWLRVDANGALWSQIAGGPTGAAALEIQGTVADGVAEANNPVLMGGSDGVNVQTLTTDASGNLQVDVLSGAGSTTPTNPARTHGSSTDTAAGSAFTLDGAEDGGTTTKLAGATLSGSVPWKAELQSVINGAGTTLEVIFGRAGEQVSWRPPHVDYYSVAHPANAGLDGFRIVITNLDTVDAADLYATLYVEE